MKKITKIFLIAVGFSMLTIALGSLTSRPVPAQAPPPSVPVMVVNTTARPVPTSAQGTTAVAGSVGASQVGSWKVNVANALNASNNPVPVFVQDTGAAGRYPFTVSANVLGLPNPANFVTIPGSIPGGPPLQTAIIEFISAFCSNPGTPGATPTADWVAINTRLNGNVITSYLVAYGGGSGSLWLGQQTKIYATPGTTIDLFPHANNGGDGCLLTASGYLLPQ